MNKSQESPKPYPPNTQICFEDVGCFSNSYPWNNAADFLPVPPDVIKTEFLLFNKKNNNQEEGLSYTNLSIINGSSFDVSLPLKILVHGFTNNRSTPWLNKLKETILEVDKVNVIIVAWGNGTAMPFYSNSTANTRMVGRQTGLLVNAIREVFYKSNPRLLKIHCIGHSLGAHTCAYASNTASIRFNRISAMDPAGPNFEDYDEAVRCDASDADFVDAIHTNGNVGGLLALSFGIVMPSGHVDFYVNGGSFQPGCPSATGVLGGVLTGGLPDPAKELGCSHQRVYQMYIESIKTSCSFIGFNCPSQAMFEKGECLSCDNFQCSEMGYYADRFKGRGSMFLSTMQYAPFCGYHHFFEMSINSKSEKNTGDLILKINSDSTKLLNAENINPGTVIKKMFTTPHDLILVNEVELNFTKKKNLIFQNPETIMFDKIKLTNLEVNEVFSSCSKETILKTGIAINVPLSENDC